MMQRLSNPGAQRQTLQADFADLAPDEPHMATSERTVVAPRRADSLARFDAGFARARTAHQRRCHEVRCAEADEEIRAAWLRMN